MTSQLSGVNDYYETLNTLKVQTTVSRRVTAEIEMPEQGALKSIDTAPFRKKAFQERQMRQSMK